MTITFFKTKKKRFWKWKHILFDKKCLLSAHVWRMVYFLFFFSGGSIPINRLMMTVHLCLSCVNKLCSKKYGMLLDLHYLCCWCARSLLPLCMCSYVSRCPYWINNVKNSNLCVAVNSTKTIFENDNFLYLCVRQLELQYVYKIWIKIVKLLLITLFIRFHND